MVQHVCILILMYEFWIQNSAAVLVFRFSLLEEVQGF